MEDDGGVKAAPVTRLRRRLSVEQSEDTKSPSTPSTPTKKRGGRLAAKPQLELIDENAPQITPKRTARRSMARDVEPAEEKPATPARRSTRVKSNTSLVLEMESVQNIDSPRAKRAARRNSQVGSDNEAPLTPARTRRTRKDSTSSVEKHASETPVTPGRARRTRKDSVSSDKQADNEPDSKPTPITEVISEEPEIDQEKESTVSGVSEELKDQNSSPSSSRKSPRLKAKQDRKSTSGRSDNENNDNLSQEKKLDTITSSKTSQFNENASQVEESDDTSKLDDKADEKSKSSDSQKNRLSICSLSLIENLDAEPVKTGFSINKSTSAVNHSNSSESKRHRTKSWTTLTASSSNDSKFFSDNESTKRKLKKREKIFNRRNQAGSEDSGPTSISIGHSEKTLTEKENTEMILNSSSKGKKERNENNKTDNVSIVMESFNANKSINFNVCGTPKIAIADVSSESNKENVEEIHSKNHKPKTPELLFDKPISSIIESVVFVEDSDSNTDSLLQSNKQLDGEDQCVPVVDQELKIQESMNIQNQDYDNINTSQQKLTSNCSCEPMDVDETMPDNIIINDSSTQQKLENIANETSNKSKRKSSMSNSILQDLEKTGNENKSTLVLSQIKDISATEHNVSKSIQESNSELLTKSVNLPNVSKDKIANHNLSRNYLTSTPVQHKDVKKFAMQMNTSVIVPSNEGKNAIIGLKNTSKKDLCKTSSSSESSEDEGKSEDLSKEINDVVEDQAEDAGEDYESGDSQNDEERKYEKDHEILEHGETLTSEDEVSNESDYEKDSFIVSSDEEDNNLLSGSGDDLDMSDNELTMSIKSKKKFNERSIKQQKNASKEMFESRHKLKAPDSSLKEKQLKNKRRRLDSSLMESEDDNSLPPKKNKRMRLDSTWESSMTKSEDEIVSRNTNTSETVSDTSEIGLKRKKKVNRLSNSICENEINEKDVGNSEKRDTTIDNLLTNETEHVKRKKNKRLSIPIISENQDSAADESVKDEIRHKTSKSLSESIYNESILNEKEITICNKSIGQDPLLTAIKQEQKTPHKGLEISTIKFTTMEDVEQVNVDENTSILKPNVSLDPLLTTVVQDSIDEPSINEDSENSSISENEEITNNYDSMLNELNKDIKRKQNKSFDVSLNLNKHTKKMVNEPILAELNITQTETSSNKNKPKKDTSVLQITGNKLKSVVKKMPNSSDDESINDSIQLRLLFSEESNDSSKSIVTGCAEDDEHFIPLKRSEGNINIPMSASEIEEKESSLNISSKKNKKNQQLPQNEQVANANANEILESSLNVSFNKKNKMRNSLPNEENATTNETENVNETLLNTSSKKKNKKNKSTPNKDSGSATANEIEIVTETSLNTSSKKKNKNRSTPNKDSGSATANEIDIVNETSLNNSSKKKNKKNTSLPNQDSGNATANEIEIVNETSLNTSSKKKNKNKSTPNKDSGSATANEIEIVTETSLNTSAKKKNKKNKSTPNQDRGSATANEIENGNETSLNTSSKKKNKSTPNQDSGSATASGNEIVKNESLNTSANKKNKMCKLTQNEDDAAANETTRDNINFFVDTKGTRLEEDTLVNDARIVSPKQKRNLIYFANDDSPILSVKDKKNVNKKRKERDDDDGVTKSKLRKQSSFDEIIPRLPTSIINSLEDQPKKSKVVSTTEFLVEKNRRKNKPSDFLEQTVYLNTDTESPAVNKKANIKKPKVLPFIPTASTSHSGFTTNFKVNIIPQKMEFVAQTSDVTNFKNDYLYNKKIKKLRTYELYRQHRNVKLSKF